jgi:hypothetical protein
MSGHSSILSQRPAKLEQKSEASQGLPLPPQGAQETALPQNSSRFLGDSTTLWLGPNIP